MAARLRTGVVLPTFRDTPEAAFAAAAEAVEAGVDGLFCYDHIWPLGQPERPALAPFPILGALAARFGPSPGGPDDVTSRRRRPVLRHAGGARRARAQRRAGGTVHRARDAWRPGVSSPGIGTGDRLSEEENRAYGIPFAPAARRRADLVTLARELAGAGLTVWIAGGPAGRTEEARAAGAALNVWDADPAVVAERCRDGELEVTWAGPPPRRLASSRRAAGGVGCGGRHLGGVRLAGRRAMRWWRPGVPPAVRRPVRRGRGRRLLRWSSAGSTGCRPTSSPPSTT